MATYPIKILKDEQNNPFVPMVTAESIRTNDNMTFEDKLATKLESDNLKNSDSVTIIKNGNDCSFEVNFGASDNIIDNLNTTVAGQGPLDARQGNVLKNMIPAIVDNLDSTDATKVLSANQGHELKEMSVPTGGAAGQVLKKASDNDHELEWGDAADPNAIVGDGSIMKIIELTYADYKTLESNGELREDTEYHITDVENGVTSYMTEEQIQEMIDESVEDFMTETDVGNFIKEVFTYREYNTANIDTTTTGSWTPVHDVLTTDVMPAGVYLIGINTQYTGSSGAVTQRLYIDGDSPQYYRFSTPCINNHEFNASAVIPVKFTEDKSHTLEIRTYAPTGTGWSTSSTRNTIYRIIKLG